MTTQLQIRVAESLGWKCVDLNDNPRGAIVKGENWVVRDPEGNNKGRGWTCDSAWQETVLPQWDTDTDTALFQLFNALPDNCTPRLVRMFWPTGYTWKGAIIVFKDHRMDHELEQEADKPAEAICWVWLDYQKEVV